ncbi:MAG TPA: flagellar hook-length control protein FliK [Spirochaetota bacterium]|nr:MAG: Flagellar hook-length control protein FliK [Spirochaetes bacterium ADurb.Bin133]HNZ27444.1 flagellar hook-length control protein FliK [Spirochaetota bacterium]HPY87299.1 flagellar hook-length control protein FliK [Spirochaetota bacterium]
MINVISNMLQSVTDESNKNLNAVFKEDNEFGKLLESMSLESDVKLDEESKVEAEYDDAELEISYKIEEEESIRSEDSVLSKTVVGDKDKIDRKSDDAKSAKKPSDIKNDRYITLVNSLNSKFKEKTDFVVKEKAGALLENSTVKIKIKFSSLDEAAKEKIKKLITDLGAGRLTKEEFNVAATQIIMNGETARNLKLNNKRVKVENVDLKVAKKESKSPDVLNSANFVSKNRTEPDKTKFNIADNGDKNDISKIASKDVKKKTNTPETANNKTEIKTEIKTEVDIKDFKTEINLLNKTGAVENREGVVKADNPRALLHANKESIFEQLAKNTKITMSENLTKFSTMIRPDNIGRMDFHITVKDGKMNGKIILQNQEAVDFFRANTEEMRAIFQKSAVEMERIDIALAGQNGQSFSFDDKNFREQDKSEDIKINALFANKIRNIFEDNNMVAGNYSAGLHSTVNLFI